MHVDVPVGVDIVDRFVSPDGVAPPLLPANPLEVAEAPGHVALGVAGPHVLHPHLESVRQSRSGSRNAFE